jgi:hypothetical protein
MSECGGCEGIGAHRKHCRRNPDYHYKLELADEAESLGDRLGQPHLANYAWYIAGILRMQVKHERESQEIPLP